MQDHIIVGVHVTDRMKNAAGVQKIFTEFGCMIKTRLGLHEVSETYCSPGGVVLLEMVGPEDKINEMVDGLKAIEGIEIQKMVFPHE